ncbi:transmembrane protein, putative (macronuclear) [Tetrahymena thermophila SB210]|uniref:Transmembrane protein, putative n=1 Tax=Tetrahymena thermophila (strain SB210) TaxID=312017 RepID=I7MM45_TETTS|nr:transmembrane protein, putative [Tetrahymena thermophila SB210]7TGH_3I Chain 3I, Transmembrane protein, putative [Tetrahymena thermophila]7TGH_3i Chain 3i, Transmembrane protein, putative [Tetrahymena thermophila]8B6J_I Chain I, Transmembrane protein, putative [Tetrahymena thermophila SB210]8B6J_i Chain i, Transmembrane protein, putative [Tetrahymena thermophila SB210]8BQS_I Chain I, Transmembrane protein, putative [Tetrahymena thermophila SB210]8BQS_i Chain i, Transmembrane protein, putat|eukprot:XP_001024186.1 transmembrane protein, putative [Tetrahymena thermophila SB210]
MVYGKLIFNNIKEYTPSWIKTIPYSQVTKPILRKQPQIVGKINADPKVKKFWVFLRENVQYYPFLWQFFILGTSFVWFHVCYDPWLAIYQANNAHRSLETALTKEKAHKKKLAEQEESE